MCLNRGCEEICKWRCGWFEPANFASRPSRMCWYDWRWVAPVEGILALWTQVTLLSLHLSWTITVRPSTTDIRCFFVASVPQSDYEMTLGTSIGQTEWTWCGCLRCWEDDWLHRVWDNGCNPFRFDRLDRAPHRGWLVNIELECPFWRVAL